MFLKSVVHRLKMIFRGGTIKWLSKVGAGRNGQLASFQEPKLANSKMAGKFAKVFPLKLNFAKSLYNYTQGLGQARLIEGTEAGGSICQGR